MSNYTEVVEFVLSRYNNLRDSMLNGIEGNILSDKRNKVTIRLSAGTSRDMTILSNY